MISGGLPCSDGNLRGAPRRSLSRIAAARIARGKQQKNVCTRRPIKMLEGTAACFYIYTPPPWRRQKQNDTGLWERACVALVLCVSVCVCVCVCVLLQHYAATTASI